MGHDPLDTLGESITQHLRDPAIEYVDGLLGGTWKAPALQSLQAQLEKLSPEHKVLLRRVIIAATDAAIHDFLFHLQEQADFENRIRLLVDGEDVVRLSDGLHGEIFGDEGWFARFSAYGSPSEQP